jgi:CheY-like chemotaxis protein
VSPDTATLLVVDDSEDNRYTLTNRLKRLGYTDVVAATDGRQALTRLRARHSISCSSTS